MPTLVCRSLLSQPPAAPPAPPPTTDPPGGSGRLLEWPTKASRPVSVGQNVLFHLLLKVEHSSSFGSSGDLELVCSGTRRHTRDVGTTFPSPAEARPSRLASSSSSGLEGRGGGGGSLPSKTQRRRKSKKSPSKVPPGTSGSPQPPGVGLQMFNRDWFGFTL